MPLLLLLETSSDVCSVAIARDEKILSLVEDKGERNHARVLTEFINSAVNEAAVSLGEIDAVCLSSGPGSYTGLRISASVSKGLCYALEKPLIAVSTLEVMAEGIKESEIYSQLLSKGKDFILQPMIDARRMEVFTATYDQEGNRLSPDQPVILKREVVEKFLERHVILFGEGVQKIQQEFNLHPHAFFLSDFIISAKFILKKSLEKFSAHNFEDLAYFEPNYTKEAYLKK